MKIKLGQNSENPENQTQPHKIRGKTKPTPIEEVTN